MSVVLQFRTIRNSTVAINDQWLLLKPELLWLLIVFSQLVLYITNLHVRFMKTITICTFYKHFFRWTNYSNTSICNYSLVWVSPWNITWQSRSQTPWSKRLSLQYLPVRHIQELAWFCLAKQVLTFLGIKKPNFYQQVLNSQVLISGCLLYFVKTQLPQINGS